MAALASKLRACVKVEGVRVAYADAQASPERPFELALSLDTLSASTLSAADAARALDGKQGAAVALETELKALRVTWRPLTEPGEADGQGPPRDRAPWRREQAQRWTQAQRGVDCGDEGDCGAIRTCGGTAR